MLLLPSLVDQRHLKRAHAPLWIWRIPEKVILIQIQHESGSCIVA